MNAFYMSASFVFFSRDNTQVPLSIPAAVSTPLPRLYCHQSSASPVYQHVYRGTEYVIGIINDILATNTENCGGWSC